MILLVGLLDYLFLIWQWLHSTHNLPDIADLLVIEDDVIQEQLEFVDININQQVIHFCNRQSLIRLFVSLHVGKTMFDYAVLILRVYFDLFRKRKVFNCYQVLILFLTRTITHQYFLESKQQFFFLLALNKFKFCGRSLNPRQLRGDFTVV